MVAFIMDELKCFVFMSARTMSQDAVRRQIYTFDSYVAYTLDSHVTYTLDSHVVVIVVVIVVVVEVLKLNVMAHVKQASQAPLPKLTRLHHTGRRMWRGERANAGRSWPPINKPMVCISDPGRAQHRGQQRHYGRIAAPASKQLPVACPG